MILIRYRVVIKIKIMFAFRQQKNFQLEVKI
jgi:hypothetical protein